MESLRGSRTRLVEISKTIIYKIISLYIYIYYASIKDGACTARDDPLPYNQWTATAKGLLPPPPPSNCKLMLHEMLTRHDEPVMLLCSPLSCSLPFLAVAAFPIVRRQGDAQLAGSGDGGWELTGGPPLAGLASKCQPVLAGRLRTTLTAASPRR